MIRWLTVLFSVSLLISVGVSHAHNHTLQNMLQYSGEYIQHLNIVVDEDKHGSITIVKIGKWSPFRRYPWFRKGDTIDKVEGKKANLLVLRSLIPNQDVWITYTRDESFRVQINLTPIFFGSPPWENKTQPAGMTLP
jgi:hypothetical protein